MRRTGLAALVAILLVGGALWFQRQQTRAARRAAETEARQRHEVEEKELRARHNLYAADMNLAQQAIVDGNFGRAEALLGANIPESGQADLRGIEWHHFWQRVRGDSAGVLRGHQEVVSSLA